MTDPRPLFRQAVPTAEPLDVAAVHARAGRLVRRRRAGIAAASLVFVALAGSGASLLLTPDRDVVLPPAMSPSSEPSESSSEPPSPSPSAMSPEASGSQQTVQIYLSTFGPEGSRCEDVVAVERQVSQTESVATAALNELFQGATADERSAGLGSTFSSETANLLRSVRIQAGIAYVDIEDTLEGINNVGTTCASTGLLAQLRATLLQFGTIREAVFATEGDPLRFYGLLQMGCPEPLVDGDSCNAAPFRN